jgi:glycosyltransferase involved in cell wall biosynthesis
VTLRIVHVITGLALGGAEMTLYKLLSAMDRERFVPVVVSLTGDGAIGERIRSLDVPVHPIGLRSGMSAAAGVWRFMSLLGRLPADVFQGWQYHGSVAAQIAHMLLGRRVPVLWNIRHCIYDLRNEKRMTSAVVKLGARLSSRADRVIYVSQVSAHQHEALGYRGDKRIVLPNGFDTDRFVPCNDARLQLRHELGLSPSTVVIGKIARYHPMKDHANFLGAASDLLQSDPDVHFVLAGEGVDSVNSELMRLVGRLSLGNRMHLLGQRDDIQRVIAALDIATSASSSEAFPNVIGEAMACGVPCVATNVGDSALIIDRLGRLVPAKQPRALSEAWRDLIDMGRDRRVAMGLEGRRRIVEQYGLRSVARRYELLYESLGKRLLEDAGSPAAIHSPNPQAGCTMKPCRRP